MSALLPGFRCSSDTSRDGHTHDGTRRGSINTVVTKSKRAFSRGAKLKSWPVEAVGHARKVLGQLSPPRGIKPRRGVSSELRSASEPASHTVPDVGNGSPRFELEFYEYSGAGHLGSITWTTRRSLSDEHLASHTKPCRPSALPPLGDAVQVAGWLKPHASS